MSHPNRPKLLRLYEEILLLELDDAKGTTGMGTWVNTEMGGAILAELVMDGTVTITNDKKKHVLVAVGRPRPDDPILVEAFGKILEAKKPKNARHWVQKFSNLKDLKKRGARSLVAKGVLREETGTVLGIFHRTIFPESNPGPEHELRQRLEEAIFSDVVKVDPGTTVIIALAKATGMLNKVFPKKRLKARKARLEELASGNLVGAATKEAVEAIQAVVLVCAIMPAITASTTAATS